MLGWRSHFEEGAVDAVADTEFVGEGFEVDVAGLVLDGLLHDEVDEADDGGLVGGLLEGLGVGVGEVEDGGACGGDFLDDGVE